MTEVIFVDEGSGVSWVGVRVDMVVWKLSRYGRLMREMGGRRGEGGKMGKSGREGGEEGEESGIT